MKRRIHQIEFARAIKKYMKLTGLEDRYKYITIIWHDKDHPIDPKRPEICATAVCRHQYGRASLQFDQDHEAWHNEQEEGTVESGVRHELGHLMVGPISQFAERLIETFEDEQARNALMKQLNDVDDMVVSWIEQMPVWDALDQDG